MRKRTIAGLSVLIVVLLGVGAIQVYFLLATHEPSKLLSLDDLPQRFAAEIPELQRIYAVPGVAVGVISEGRVWNTWGFGWADRERGIAVDEDTVFNVASISKALTAWGVMRLVETGRVELDAAVGRYLKRWSLPPSEFDHNAVTVRALLGHRAGISQGRIDTFVPIGAPMPSILEALNADIEGQGPVRIASKPGALRYSNGGYAILQLMIEDVTGQPFADYMRDEVLRPLGMTSSSFFLDEPTIAKLAQWYDTDGNVAGTRRQYAYAAAAGLNTTLADLLRFTLASLSFGADRTAGVISLTALEEMRKHPKSELENFGLGYEFVERLPRFGLHAVRFVGHSGAGKGYTGVVAMVPTTGDALVVMENGSNAILPQILCIWANVRFGVDCADRSPPVAMPQVVLEELAGTYAVPNDKDIVLRSENGVLVMFQDERVFSLVLSADQNKFSALYAPLAFTVKRADDGSVASLALRKMLVLSSRATRVSSSVRLDHTESCRAGLVPPAVCSATN